MFDIKSMAKINPTDYQLIFFIGDFFEFGETFYFLKVKEYGSKDTEFDYYTVFLIIMMLVGIFFTIGL